MGWIVFRGSSIEGAVGDVEEKKNSHTSPVICKSFTTQLFGQRVPFTGTNVFQK